MGDVLANRSNAKNAKRDFMNKLLRENEWPGLYWAEIPTADLRTGKVQLTWVPFLLPHEWLPLYTRWEESLDDLEPEEDYMRSARRRLAETLHADPHELFQRRGGNDNPGKNSETLLLRWCRLTPFLHPF